MKKQIIEIWDILPYRAQGILMAGLISGIMSLCSELIIQSGKINVWLEGLASLSTIIIIFSISFALMNWFLNEELKK